jgi:hypothetical protein
MKRGGNWLRKRHRGRDRRMKDDTVNWCRSAEIGFRRSRFGSRDSRGTAGKHYVVVYFCGNV